MVLRPAARRPWPCTYGGTQSGIRVGTQVGCVFFADDAVAGQSFWGYGQAIAGATIAIFSPLFGAMADAGSQVLKLIQRLRTELKVNTTCGASNISFGLPNRPGLNPTFLAMAIGAGMTSAITNPLEPSLMQAVRAADVVMGHDKQCKAWIAAHREPGEARGRRGRRRRRGG